MEKLLRMVGRDAEHRTAAISEVGSTAAIVGQHTFLLYPTDPLPDEFLPGLGNVGLENRPFKA
jgi:proline racemase